MSRLGVAWQAAAMNAVRDFAVIAWPALLVLLGLLGFIGWGIREHRRTHPRGRYREQAMSDDDRNSIQRAIQDVADQRQTGDDRGTT